MIIELPAGAHRVSLRRVDGAGRASDVVGHLVAANAEQLVVLPEDKPALWLPRAEVRTLRSVAERTVLPASPAGALQRILDGTWPGLRRARLGGWVLRSGTGRTKRANSVLVTGDPGLPWLDALAAAAGWLGKRPTLQIVADDPIIPRALASGFEAVTPTIVMVARLDDLTPEPLEGASVTDQPGEGFVGLWRNGGIDPEALAEVTAAPARYVSLPGVASGRVAVERDWAVLASLEVAEDRRGEGLGRKLVGGCIIQGRSDGARFVALQVEESNFAARSLYESQGFVEHHRYCYLVPRP